MKKNERIVPFIWLPVRTYLGLDMDGIIAVPADELVYATMLTEAIPKENPLDKIEVICIKCWKDRPATQKRCKCGGLYVVIKEETNVEPRS